MLQLIAPYPEPWHFALKTALTGDALGVPHEFKPAHAVPNMHDIQMRMPGSYRKTYAHVPYGTCSDDGSQMLALADLLVELEGKFDSNMFGARLIDWYRNGAFQPGGEVFDIGMHTRDSLEAREAGEQLRHHDNSQGNGSLMRVLPVAAMPDTFSISRNDALAIAMDQSAVTHAHAMCRAACALYVQLCWEVQSSDAKLRTLVSKAFESLRWSNLYEGPDWKAIETLVKKGQTQMPTGSGFVVDSFWSAVWAVDCSTSAHESLRMAISLGDDTDTTACIAGGLAGLRFGRDETVQTWWADVVQL